MPYVGRPRVRADIDDIMCLRELHYTWTKVAALLNISRATLYRRLNEAGISPHDYTPLSERQLDAVIRSIKQYHPNDGEVLMRGHLLSQGIRVSRQALRAAIHRVDHANVIARRRSVVRRRVYSVPHPNYLWHMDGHHKLIRWRLVIHAAIDGFSHTITYIECADNNRADTVLAFFHSGVTRFGLPDYVRSDHGGENTGVWRYMIVTHGDYSCVLTGSSVHNERVERLWRDVHRCIGSCYADTFRALEGESVLDPLNEVDLYCLHLIFLPRINKSLHDFQESWNNHSLSSEGNMTPYQLLFEGLNFMVLNDDLRSTHAAADVDVSELTRDHVHIPSMAFIPCASLIQNLSGINPLQSSSDNGKTMYLQAIQIAGQHLSAGCSQCVV